jgi:hypothetical protein
MLINALLTSPSVPQWKLVTTRSSNGSVAAVTLCCVWARVLRPQLLAVSAASPMAAPFRHRLPTRLQASAADKAACFCDLRLAAIAYSPTIAGMSPVTHTAFQKSPSLVSYLPF